MKIEFHTVSNQIYRALLDEIISGDLAAGTPLRLQELAERFQVSLIPVRDALQQMEGARLVEREKNRRLVVKQLSVETYNEIMEARLLLECLLLQKAIEKGTPEVKRRLRELELEMRAQSDMREFLRLNHEFHHTLYRCAEAPVLYQLVNDLWLQLSPYLKFYQHAERTHQTADTAHAGILDAFCREDADAACGFLQEDLLKAKDSVVSILKRAIARKWHTAKGERDRVSSRSRRKDEARARR